MVLSDYIKNFIKGHSYENPNEEICGLIYEKDNELIPYKCQNLSDDRSNTFILSPSDYLKVSSMGKIIAVYHSHPFIYKEDFSDFDKINSEKLNLVYILFSLKDESFKIYEPSGRSFKYINREYIIGYIDCFSLIQDFYKNEKNIIIKDLNSHYRFCENKPDHPDNINTYYIYEDFLESQGFTKVNSLKLHDVILMKTLSIKSSIHGAIFMGNNSILHHPYKKYSLIEEYKDSYKRLTTCFYRHKNSL